MLDHAALTPEALSYFHALPLADQIAMNHSNLALRTLEDLKAYQARNAASAGALLCRRLPGPDLLQCRSRPN